MEFAMVNTVIIGGPPHAGKSVLFYSLTSALRQRGIPHHTIRACPDGEGNWSQEIEQAAVQVLRIKGVWTEEFIERISLDLSRRLLPMLVDVGGYPTETQTRILRQCTHALLLLHEHDTESTAFWLNLTETCGLLPLARIFSSLTGLSTIRTQEPIITGTLVGLERGTHASGPLFDLLVGRIATLFSVSSPDELERLYLDQAPTALVINLPSLLQTIAPGATRWQPEMLLALLKYIPAQTPLSVYGQGPHWVYAALAYHAGSQAFYQFDPRLGSDGSNAEAGVATMGWIAPLVLRIAERQHPDIIVQRTENSTSTRLSLTIVKKHLSYWQAASLPFPPLSTQRGLILDGSMPSWLLTALVRLYAVHHLPWIACHQPQLKGAVVIASRTAKYRPGHVMPFSG
jgi:CRISPR-associated protein Csx3